MGQPNDSQQVVSGTTNGHSAAPRLTRIVAGSGTICAPPLMLYWDSMCSGGSRESNVM